MVWMPILRRGVRHHLIDPARTDYTLCRRYRYPYFDSETLSAAVAESLDSSLCERCRWVAAHARPVRDRRTAWRTLIEFIDAHDLSGPQAVSLWEFPPEPDSDINYRRDGWGIVDIGCVTATEVHAWCAAFSVEVEDRDNGSATNQHSITWGEWRVIIRCPAAAIPPTHDGGTS